VSLGHAEIPSYALYGAERRAFHELGAALARRFDSATQSLDVDLAGVPGGLREFVARFADDPPRCGFTLIRGIRIDELPPTPQNNTAGLDDDHGTAGNLLTVAELLGSLIGYADEKDGALLHEVHPVRGEESRIENTGSMTFGFHTENVHHPLRPDFLGLLCLRQDHDRLGTARLSSIREAAVDLSDATLSILREARFRSLYPTSFTRGRSGERPSSQPHPVIFGDAPELFMRFNVHNTYAADEPGEAALRELAAALDHTCRQVLLEPGDLVIINNHVTAHGRSAFVPRYDGHDRWLRRFYSLRTVPAWVRDVMPSARVLPPLSGVHRAQRAA
jgi:L-asparagine oxygenase